jgi:hypothetical protein
VGDQTFYLDLLFYHVRLHCYFVIELKTGEFKPEYAGKLNFYLSAVDGIMKSDRDDPTIGLLLCESHNEAIVELSFKNLQKPIGVSTYTVTREMRRHWNKRFHRSKTSKVWLKSSAQNLRQSARRSRPSRRKKSERPRVVASSQPQCLAGAGRPSAC